MNFFWVLPEICVFIEKVRVFRVLHLRPKEATFSLQERLNTGHHASWRPPGRFLDYCRFLFSSVQSTCAGIHIQLRKNISSGTFEKKSHLVKMCCICNICCIRKAHVLHMRHVLHMQHMLHMRSTGVAYATYVAYAKRMCCVCNVCYICEVH